MLGTVPHAELLGLYRERAVDCVVLPSVDLGAGVHEGLSVALIEAMAYGIPVISTTTGGLPELLDDWRRPARALNGTPTALAHALEGLLASPISGSTRARGPAANRGGVRRGDHRGRAGAALRRRSPPRADSRDNAARGGRREVAVTRAQRPARHPEFRSDEPRLRRARHQAGQVPAGIRLATDGAHGCHRHRRAAGGSGLLAQVAGIEIVRARAPEFSLFYRKPATPWRRACLRSAPQAELPGTPRHGYSPTRR